MTIPTQPPDYLFADSLIAALRAMDAIVEAPAQCHAVEDGRRCTRALYSKNLCQLHYRRLAKYGDVRVGYGTRECPCDTLCATESDDADAT